MVIGDDVLYSAEKLHDKIFDTEFIILNREILYTIFKHYSNQPEIEFFFHDHMSILNSIYTGSMVMNLKGSGLYIYLSSQLIKASSLKKYSPLVNKAATVDDITAAAAAAAITMKSIKLYDCIGTLLTLFYFSKLNGKQRE